MGKTALLTGFTGQDGSYLSELLLSKGYQVTAFVRPSQTPAGLKVESRFGVSGHLVPHVDLRSFREDSTADWESLLTELQPDEIYHLGAFSSVVDSWCDPLRVSRANIDLTAILLDAMRKCSGKSRLFFACSSEVFGSTNDGPQNEHSAIQPSTPYGVSKAAGHWLSQSYRQHYGLYVCSGILFNHESPRRPESFVSRKITRAAAKIKLGYATELELGDLSACRDWGFASDFVDAMWRMLQCANPDDFVIGTGQLTSVQTIAEIAFAYLGLDWQKYVRTNSSLIRQNDPRRVFADIKKANRILDWQPTTPLSKMVEIMVQNDIDSLLDFGYTSLVA